MWGSASDIEVVQRGMSELFFELAPVVAGPGLVEVGLKTEVEIEGDGREAFGLGAEQRTLVPARESGQGEGETGFAQAPTLVGGSGGDPVDEAIIETAVAVPIPGADGADGDILCIDDKKASLGYRTKIVTEFSREEISREVQPFFGFEDQIRPRGTLVGVQRANGEAGGHIRLRDLAQVRTDHVDGVAGRGGAWISRHVFEKRARSYFSCGNEWLDIAKEGS